MSPRRREIQTPLGSETVITRRPLPPGPPGGDLPPRTTLGYYGDPQEIEFGNKWQVQMKDWARMTPARFVRESFTASYVTLTDLEKMVLLVEKVQMGAWRKRGELRPTDGTDPEQVESHLVETWGQGRYRLILLFDGKEYAPRSRVYELGDDPTAGDKRKDPSAAIADAAETIGQTVTLTRLKQLGGQGDDDMKMGDLAALITALRQGEPRREGPDPLVLELIRQTQESNKAIIEKLAALEAARTKGPDFLTALPHLTPVLTTLARNPEAITELIARYLHLPGATADAPARTFVDSIMEYLGPALATPTAQQIMQAIIAKMAQPPAPPAPAAGEPIALPPGAPAWAAYPPGPPPPGSRVAQVNTAGNGYQAPAPPASQEGLPMPIALNPEQQAAADQIVGYASAGDLVNAFAALEMFPQSDPIPGVAPLGVNLAAMFLEQLDRVKRQADPRVAVPALRALFPKLSLEDAAALIGYAQKRLIDEEDQSIAARESGHGEREE